MIGQTVSEQEAPGKRELLRDWLLKGIRTGELKPGDIVPTRIDLSERFQCARATADYVITELVEEKVLTSSRGKGTFVTSLEDAQPIEAVSVINCLPSFSWSAEIEQGMFAGLGQKLPIARFNIGDIQQPVHWEKCKRSRTLVFIMPGAEDSSFLVDARNRGISHLVLYRDPPESSFINVDHRAAGRAMVAALKARGCRRIAWVSKTESRFKTPEERYVGILEGLLENGLAFRRQWGGFMAPADEAAYIQSLFSTEEKPDAVILGQHSAMGMTLKAIASTGLVAGTDVTIALMDEIEPGSYPFGVLCAQRLTVKVGEAAARILMQPTPLARGELLRRYLEPRIVTL